jgi:hypothetical protein
MTTEVSWSPAGDLPNVDADVTFHDMALTIAAGLDVGDWTELVARLAAITTGAPWWLGDALVYGDYTYGEKYAKAVEATGRSVNTLKNYRWVAGKVPPENRDAALPWRTYREIARLDTAEQADWIARVKAEGWTADDLRREILAASHRDEPTPEFEPTTEDEQSQLDQVMAKCPECGHRFAP